jgi:hypothetical protein
MAYIPYGQNTTGGKQLAEAMNDLVTVADRLRDLAAWIGELGVNGLETNGDFSVSAGQGQGFNDTILQINADMVSFMAANREKIARLARGA